MHWLFDIQFFMWIARLKFRLPLKLQLGIQNLLFGYTDAVAKQTENYINRVRQRMPARFQQQQQQA